MRKWLFLSVSIVFLLTASGIVLADTPSKYLIGSGVKEIYSNLDSLKGEMVRGEFEKKEAYAKRVKSIQPEVKRFFIEMPAYISYDVDKEEFNYYSEHKLLNINRLEHTAHASP